MLLTIVAEEVKVTREEPPAMASTVQLAFFLPERSNSPPYFENDQYDALIVQSPEWPHVNLISFPPTVTLPESMKMPRKEQRWYF